MKNMAGRKKHSAEDVVRKLRRADELAAAGKTNEEITAELEVSPATLYNWRRSYGEPLMTTRKAQAGDLFKVLDYKQGEQMRDWYDRHGISAGTRCCAKTGPVSAACAPSTISALPISTTTPTSTPS